MSSSSAALALRRVGLLLPVRQLHRHLASSPKTAATSDQRVALRHSDPSFEKLMDFYKHLLRLSPLLDLLASSPSGHRLPLPLPFPIPYLRRFPHLLHLSPTSVRLTPSALRLLSPSPALPLDPLLHRLLLLSPSRTLPVRALLRCRRPLALPASFPLHLPPPLLLLPNPAEPNTHLLTLPSSSPSTPLPLPAIHHSRPPDSPFAFPLSFPPGMRLRKGYKAKLRQWQRLPYPGPYDEFRQEALGRRAMEKRAVGIAHEFLSLTAEGMVEVEQFSQFRSWFRIDGNVRDLFLRHPGIFYISTKGGRHTVFLREAYDRGRLKVPNPVFAARRGLLELVMQGRRGTLEEEEGSWSQLEDRSLDESVHN